MLNPNIETIGIPVRAVNLHAGDVIRTLNGDIVQIVGFGVKSYQTESGPDRFEFRHVIVGTKPDGSETWLWADRVAAIVALAQTAPVTVEALLEEIAAR